MSVMRTTTIVIALIAALISPPGPASAQEKSAQFRLGVVDIVQITQKSKMTIDIARQIDKKRNIFREEIKAEEVKLRNTNEELQKQRVILSPEAFQAEVIKFREKERTLQRKVQERNQEFNHIRNLTNNDFKKELNKALMEITKKHNFTLILKKREVLVVAKILDITPVVLQQLNKNVPSYKLPDKPEKPKNAGK
ncbi:MAG: OmpH family outer membrane protein [Rhodospirillales bacterium]|nr:OmpH family outer membrane protein [Rhodospirillales bacterium]